MLFIQLKNADKMMSNDSSSSENNIAPEILKGEAKKHNTD